MNDENSKNIQFLDYNERFNEELNNWQEIEKQNGESGILKFVAPNDILLGYFIEYVTDEIGLISKIAIKDNEIIGTISCEIRDIDTAYIEILVVNPKFRKKGYGQQILKEFNEYIKKETGVIKSVFIVKKSNTAGIKSFSKVAKANVQLNNADFLGFEL